MSHGTKTNSCTPPTLASPPYHLLGTSFDASFGYRLAIIWLLSGPKREEAMGKRLPNDMPNEQWGWAGIEMKGRWGLALCHEHLLQFLCICIRGFEKGLADRGGWHNSGAIFCCISGAVGRQPPPANPFSKPLRVMDYICTQINSAEDHFVYVLTGSQGTSEGRGKQGIGKPFLAVVTFWRRENNTEARKAKRRSFLHASQT